MLSGPRRQGSGVVLMVLKLEHAVGAIAASKDDSRIVFGSGDGSVCIWEASTGERLKILKGHSGYVCCIMFSNDGSRIVSGSHDKTIRVWGALTGEERALESHTNVQSVAISADGLQIVSGSLDASVRLWDVTTDEQLKLLKGHTDLVESVAFTNGGSQIVWLARHDGAVVGYNIGTGAEGADWLHWFSSLGCVVAQQPNPVWLQ